MKEIDVLKLPPGVHTIEKGLYLKVNATGSSRRYLAKLTVEGKRKEISLGSAKDISLGIAKIKFEELLFQHTVGALTNDSIKETKAKEREAKNERRRVAGTSSIKQEVPTFKEFAQAAIEKIAATKRWTNAKSLSQWQNTLATYVYPKIGDIPIDKVTRMHIVQVLSPIWETKNDTASKLRGRLEKILTHAIFEGLLTGLNPATWRGNLEMIFPPPSKVHIGKHHEAISLLEAKGVALKYYESGAISEVAVLFGLLTASRLQEFLFAKWREVDFKHKVWLCPPERRKDRKPYPHRVPLSTQAIELLERLDRSSEYIFKSPRGSRPMSLDTCRITLSRTVGRKVTMHGCRSTFRDWCADNLIDPILAEKSLMHATGNEVEQAYQRSDLLEQRRVVMQKWADALFF